MQSISTLTLSELPLFRGLTVEDLTKLKCHLHLKTVSAGANINLVGQSDQALYIILSGVVHLQIDQLNGTIVILATLEPGEIIDNLGMTDKLEYPTSAVAREDTTLLWMNYSVFREHLNTMPVLAFNLIGMMTNRLHVMYKKLQLLAAREVHERVAGHLIALAEKYGQQRDNGEVYVPRRFTQSELADHVGASRVRVNQAVALFKRCRYISIDKHLYITIYDVAALAAIAGYIGAPLYNF
ncbi:Crp/Fnr family transcriptional regulator [Dictyobacter formicarum]|uniref:Crp/Fnr family transcriptional regulator n=1 Tax=Dictyobacter formicarum TaxID=2778368 RepID=A0ABQ3VSG7_9CHLR|nr:Crp/Fnr family transcriptional regulator [Dictyobacter formicarum]GHO88865.1 Crp/Fnr family transcriptional regulator [Dictyobacter formicarum]